MSISPKWNWTLSRWKSRSRERISISLSRKNFRPYETEFCQIRNRFSVWNWVWLRRKWISFMQNWFSFRRSWVARWRFSILFRRNWHSFRRQISDGKGIDHETYLPIICFCLTRPSKISLFWQNCFDNGGNIVRSLVEKIHWKNSPEFVFLIFVVKIRSLCSRISSLDPNDVSPGEETWIREWKWQNTVKTD